MDLDLEIPSSLSGPVAPSPLQPDVRRGAAGQRILHRQRNAPHHAADATRGKAGIVSRFIVLGAFGGPTGESGVRE